MPDGITANAGGREYASSGARMIPPIPAQNRTGARAFALVMRWLVRIAALLTAAVLIFLIGYILVMGIPNLKPSLFEWTYNSENVSLVPSLINTVLMTAFSLVIATPLGIFAAVWLVEYAKRGNKLVKVVRVTTETLQGIPSIVFGLFGMLFFVSQLHWGYSLIAGAFTLAIMVLPVIMRTTEEALLAVPDSYREGSFGLGAGKLRTVFTIVLPSAMPGILSGVILAVGRGRDRRADLHRQHGGRHPGKCVQLHPYPGRAHVPAVQRGPARRRHLRHRRGAAGAGAAYQLPVQLYRGQTCERKVSRDE